MCKHLFEYLFSVLKGMYLGVESLDPMVILLNSLKKTFLESLKSIEEIEIDV